MCTYCSGCGSCASSMTSYSSLENKVYSLASASYSMSSGSAQYNLPSSSPSSSYSDISHLVSEAVSVNSESKLSAPAPYVFNSKSAREYNSKLSKPVTFSYTPFTEQFLISGSNVFVNEISELMPFVKEAFRATTGKELPKDIRIHLLSDSDFKKAHLSTSGSWNNGIMGFAINRRNTGMPSEVFVKKSELGRVMLTLGHELGHVITPKLRTAKDEEAKAFAFSLAWMKSIKENNIANLASSISLDAPAVNGLHDVALDFVLNLVKQGADSFELFNDFVNKELVVM